MADIQVLRRQLADALDGLESYTYDLRSVEDAQNWLADATDLLAQIRYELEKDE